MVCERRGGGGHMGRQARGRGPQCSWTRIVCEGGGGQGRVKGAALLVTATTATALALLPMAKQAVPFQVAMVLAQFQTSSLK